MKFLIGDKQSFLEFLASITKKDGFSLLSHNDLDGIGSSILIGEILKARGLEKTVKSRRFVEPKKNLFSNLYPELKKEKLSGIFFLDLNAENFDAEGFEKLREEFKTFTIDHHPLGKLKDLKNIVKTETPFCTTFICYELGRGIIDPEKWNWLVCSALVADVCYRNPEVLKFIQETYPQVTEQNIRESELGKISSIASSALIYFADNPMKVYELIRNKKLKQLEKYDVEVREEVGKWMKKYKAEAEYFPDRNLYYYYYNPKFNITSIVSNLLSATEPDTTFVSVSDIRNEEGMVKLSMRNSNLKENMIELAKRGIDGFENATAGGHIPAVGGSFMKKDVDKFKENILG